jgi:hypothetical protein
MTPDLLSPASYAFSPYAAPTLLTAIAIAIYPFGYLPVLAFIILTARAVWRYRLLDITPAFAAEGIINALPRRSRLRIAHREDLHGSPRWERGYHQ